ncbi:unnamed protein product [Cylindrotheca closterium]|uniref:Uncharacterized protein n=2 Tax=Cylindrotheca closterium TaxID=2856 RepID=A0AAD2JI06_9STRA|nr:unnamed protein product [Cylindrotheca closterium]
MPSKKEKKPKIEKEHLDQGARLLITGGEYATSDYKRCWVDLSKGNAGYSGENSVNVGMTFKGSEKFYTTRLNTSSVIPRSLVFNKNAGCDKFLNNRDKESRKILKGMGDVARSLAKYAYERKVSPNIAKSILKYVFYKMFEQYRGYLGDSADEQNSEAGLEMPNLGDTPMNVQDDPTSYII